MVGKQKIPVPIFSVMESLVLGFNCRGFKCLVEKMYGNVLDGTKTWRQIDDDLKEKILSILSKYNIVIFA